VAQDLWQLTHSPHRGWGACPHGIGIGEEREDRLDVVDGSEVLGAEPTRLNRIANEELIAHAPAALAGLGKPGGVRNVPATTFGNRTENWW
jgi:hypothetical protein